MQLRSSSAASGGREGGLAPIGLKSMQNTTFLVLLRPIFAPKMKTATPMGLGSRSCEGLPVIWTRNVEFFFSGSHPKLVKKTDWISVKTFFLFFFGDHLISAGKTVSILVKTFFFWRSPDFDRKTASIWFKTDENLGKVRFLLFPASKNPPPLCEFLATRQLRSTRTLLDKSKSNQSINSLSCCPYFRVHVDGSPDYNQQENKGMNFTCSPPLDYLNILNKVHLNFQ